jgi:hypothetical protein
MISINSFLKSEATITKVKKTVKQSLLFILLRKSRLPFPKLKLIMMTSFSEIKINHDKLFKNKKGELVPL